MMYEILEPVGMELFLVIARSWLQPINDFVFGKWLKIPDKILEESLSLLTEFQSFSPTAFALQHFGQSEKNEN